MNYNEDLKLMSIHEVAETGLIKEYTLRRLVKQGVIPCVLFGVKQVVNFYTVRDFLLQATAIA